MTRHLSITLSASIATLLASAPLAAGYSLRLVAQTGDLAPGSLNGSFIALGHPQINASGQVAFVGYTDGAIADTGMWKTKFDNPQQLALVIGQDYPVPGSPPDVRFGAFVESNHHPLLVDNGDIGFAAPVESPLFEGTGIFRMVNGSIQRVLVHGDAAPGTGPGVTVASIGNLPSVSPDLEFAINADLAGPGVNDGNERIVYRANSNGVVTKVARSGDAAPGLRGTDFMLWPLQLPQIHNNGEVAVRVSLEGAVTQSWSRWHGTPGNLDLIVKRGDAAPLGGTFAGDSIDFWTMTLTDDAVTMSEEVETNIGVYRTIARFDSDGATELAREGKLGPLGFYAEISDAQPEVANDGTTVFVARFNGIGLPADEDTAIVRRRPGVNPVALLQEGDPAPGYGLGVEFDQFLGVFTDAWLSVTNTRRLLVNATVRGPGININNDRGVWVLPDTDAPDGAPEFVIREGQWLSIGGALRQVKMVTVANGSGINSGRRPGINEHGDVAMKILFTNDDQAIVVAQPGSQCAGDLNADGIVDAADLALLLGSWGEFGPVGTGGDVDLDGDTDGGDLATLLGAWGACPE